MRRKIPYGVMNWAEVVREHYFVDNTAYLRALEDVKTPVFLGPKRFGKSLWCSMFGYYYDVGFKDRFDELFGWTEIGRDPTPLHNSFLVLKWDVLPMYYSIETEYNTPDGRCDFLAVPKPGVDKPALLVEFKYFTGVEADRLKVLGRTTPDEETVAQAKRYRASLPKRPGWNHPVETAVVEVCGNRGYNWFDI